VPGTVTAIGRCRCNMALHEKSFQRQGSVRQPLRDVQHLQVRSFMTG